MKKYENNSIISAYTRLDVKFCEHKLNKYMYIQQ